MKRVVVLFKKSISFQGRLYEKGFSIDALRVSRRSKSDESPGYLALDPAGIFFVTADDVEELPEPEL